MLRTWAADGTPMVRLGDRMIKQLGVASIGWSHTGASRTGVMTDARIGQWPNNTPVVWVLRGRLSSAYGGVNFSFSGNNLHWAYSMEQASALTRPDFTFMYGLY